MIAALADGKLTALRHLDIARSTRFTNAGVRHVARGNFPSLERLIIRSERVTMQSLREVVGSKTLKKLSAVSCTEMQNLGETHIPMSMARTLRALDLSSSQLNDVWAKMAFAHAVWPALEALALYRNIITSVGAAFMNRSSLPKLAHLDVRRNKIDVAGIARLATQLAVLWTFRAEGNHHADGNSKRALTTVSSGFSENADVDEEDDASEAFENYFRVLM